MWDSDGIEKSHLCKWSKLIQWYALPYIEQSTQQWNKGPNSHLHGWDFSIPNLPEYGTTLIQSFTQPILLTIHTNFIHKPLNPSQTLFHKVPQNPQLWILYKTLERNSYPFIPPGLIHILLTLHITIIHNSLTYHAT